MADVGQNLAPHLNINSVRRLVRRDLFIQNLHKAPESQSHFLQTNLEKDVYDFQPKVKNKLCIRRRYTDSRGS